LISFDEKHAGVGIMHSKVLSMTASSCIT